MVTVGLGIGDVVLEPKWFRLKKAVNSAESKITVVRVRYNDTECEEVVDIFEKEILLLHLSPHTSGVLGSALHRHQGHSIGRKRDLYGLLGPGTPLAAGVDHCGEFAMNLVEGICVEDLQRRIFDPSAEPQLTEFLRLDRIMFPDFQGDFSGPRILRAIVLEQYTAVEEVPLKNLVFGRMPRAIEFERIEEFGIDVGFSK